MKSRIAWKRRYRMGMAVAQALCQGGFEEDCRVCCWRACRFLWVIQYLVGAGFYVIPAYMPADNSADQIVAANPDVFVRNWANLWTAITDVPTYNSTLRGGSKNPVLQPCSHALARSQSRRFGMY